MNDPLLILTTRSVIGAGPRRSPDPRKSIWIDSIVDLCDPVWVDSDDDDVEIVEESLAIGPFEVCPSDPVDRVGTSPFIWLNDSFSELEHRWCDSRNESVPSLLIEVDSDEGLTRKDIDLASAFLDYLGVGV